MSTTAARSPAGWPLPAGTPLPWLASVRSAAEAQLALAAGAAIIDAKEPRQGALGALPLAEIAAIVAAVDGRAPVSATVGDLPLDPLLLAPAMRAVAAAGVDIVKIGLFAAASPGALERCLAGLPQDLPNARGGATRVMVLMADRIGSGWPLAVLARHGFAGVMLDTADKAGGSLRRVLPAPLLAAFLEQAHGCGLRAGLAGSLRLADIAPLAELQPDFLGFRSALCAQGARTGVLDAAACRQLAACLAALPPLHDAQASRPSSLTGPSTCRA